jgi:hypothetical protein
MRDYTNRLLEAAEEGMVSWEQIARIATDYMTEAQVQDMCESDFPEVCSEEDFDDE